MLWPLLVTAISFFDVGFRVKGDLNKHDLEPRFKKIGGDEIERKLDEGREKGKQRFEAIEKLKTL